jgi:hypothetical protein|tara:strand:+ start:1326 stop:1967 length:642 start_codon:yes stop_codon:yes gene_type:complete
VKKFLTILILSFCIQISTLADDIRKFKIEGIGIGDSALDYFSEDQIKNNKRNYYNNDKFVPSEFAYLESFKIYDAIQITYKSDDKEYRLHGIAGFIDFPKNIKDCNKKMIEIIKDVSELFPDTKKEKHKGKHKGDPYGKSIFARVIFNLDLASITIECTDWSKEIGYLDNLRVGIKTKEFITWLRNKAYKNTDETFFYIPSENIFIPEGRGKA